jgi:hypothetical protein
MNPLIKSAFTILTLAVTLSFASSEQPKVLFVSQPKEASWQDFAFLAAVPASRMVNHGDGAVIALDETDRIPREVEDYLRRLKPDEIFRLGEKPLSAAPQISKLTEMSCQTADEAACIFAEKFWTNIKRVVLCREDDYASALMASTLAARLQAPLLFCGEKGLSNRASDVVSKLQASEKLFIGKAPAGMNATEMPDVTSVLTWLKKQGLATPYLAVVNTRDRSSTTVHKLSLAAPIFAAAREGMVVPLEAEIHWRQYFPAKEIKEELPKGIPSGKFPPKSGIIDLPEGKLPFVLGYGPKGDEHHLFLDFNNDGNFDGPNEGPLRGNGVMNLLGKPRTVDFGRKFGTDHELTLTTGSAEQIITPLRKLYAATAIPRYLCLVGFPDAIPQTILTKEDTDITSDLPYANADDDLFAEIAVGRIIAENATFATLHASRTITYDQLLDPSWSSRAGQARWENTMGKNFENIGLDASATHDKDDLEWIKPPSDKDKGKRAGSFKQDSPLTRVGFLTHMAHSWWKDLGETYDMNSSILLSPVVIESGGCLTCTLDYEPGFHSVVARLMRNGAISFTGQTRPGIAEQEQQRAVFWNHVLTGSSIGEAHRHALNSIAAVVLETGQTQGGPQHYQLHIRSLFGDPAFTPHLPSAPKSALAGYKVKDQTVSVHAPAEWWPTRMRVPEDWKLWADKPLYVLRGSGTYPIRSWCDEEYDHEETYADAEFTTARKIKSITQVQSAPKPLGWNSKHTVDENPDGTRTYRWRVRLADFDQKTGVIQSKLDSIDYQIEFEP